MDSKVCRVCLADNVMMHCMGDIGLRRLYEKFTSTKFNPDDGRPATICYICRLQLQRFYRFSEMSRKAEKMLTDLVSNGVEITLEHVRAGRLLLNLETIPNLTLATTSFVSINIESAPVAVKEEPNEVEEITYYFDDIESVETGDRTETKKRKLSQTIKRNIEENKPVNKLLLKEKRLPEMKKHWHNLTTILKHSNVTPFKDRNDAGYMCAYCSESFPDPVVLRAHTHGDHYDEKRTYKSSSVINNFIAYLDIVDLKCTICDHPKPDLKSLIEHLVAAHQKQYFLGETDYFVPFKLTDELQMNCCICFEPFHNMKLLMQHMNVHYRNFICTICGAGFVTNFRLFRHESTHVKKKSSFPCKQCDAVFATDSKRKAHINTEHKGIAGDSVCRICKARFKNYYQKTRHMVQVHNAEGVKCEVCEKRFNLKSNLIVHMKNVHEKERPYKCSECNMGFFIKRQMLYHYTVTHTNERHFKCEVCGKAYATQCSKRKHMKKNHGTIPKPQ